MIADALQLSRRSLVAPHTEFPSDPSPSMRKMPTDKPADTDDSLDDGVWTPTRALPSIALTDWPTSRNYLGTLALQGPVFSENPHLIHDNAYE